VRKRCHKCRYYVKSPRFEGICHIRVAVYNPEEAEHCTLFREG